jgi:hypothetical protein
MVNYNKDTSTFHIKLSVVLSLQLVYNKIVHTISMLSRTHHTPSVPVYSFYTYVCNEIVKYNI